MGDFPIGRIFPNSASDIFSELKIVLKKIYKDNFDFSELETVYADIIRLFKGNLPGFQECKTKYHDLEHTLTVALALSRLIDGYCLEGGKIDPKDTLLVLISALFHDVGLIQMKGEADHGTGAKYTVGHEARSIEFLEKYLKSKNTYSDEIFYDCSRYIETTKLSKKVSDINFRDENKKMLGKMLGTADIITQMADKLYLDKLKYLFEEFQEAGIDHFESEYDLLQKTGNFYDAVTKNRVENEFDNVEYYMKIHFKERTGNEVDYYMESIQRNLKNLTIVLEKAGKNYARFINRELLE